MRTYGRIWSTPVNESQEPGAVPVWAMVQTDSNGNDDWVWLTTLCQVLQLGLGESPFYANFGIPAQPSLVQQVFPDYYVALTQQSFAQYFASLAITRTSDNPPTYQVNVTTHSGIQASATVSIPI